MTAPTDEVFGRGQNQAWSFPNWTLGVTANGPPPSTSPTRLLKPEHVLGPLGEAHSPHHQNKHTVLLPGYGHRTRETQDTKLYFARVWTEPRKGWEGRGASGSQGGHPCHLHCPVPSECLCPPSPPLSLAPQLSPLLLSPHISSGSLPSSRNDPSLCMTPAHTSSLQDPRPPSVQSCYCLQRSFLLALNGFPVVPAPSLPGPVLEHPHSQGALAQGQHCQHPTQC